MNKSNIKIQSKLFLSLVILVGFFLYLIRFAYLYHLSPNNFSPLSVAVETLSETGLMVLGAAIITTLFSWISRKENAVSIEESLGAQIDRLSLAIRKMVNESNSHHDFRWVCWMTPLSEAQKKASISDQYWNQTIEMSWYAEAVKNTYSAIFAAGGNEDGLLSEYFNDDEFILNYKIECDDEFTVLDKGVCELLYIKIDDELVNPVKVNEQVKGKDALLYKFDVSPESKERIVNFKIAFRVIKWHAQGKRVYIPKQLFNTTDHASFRLFLDRELGVENVVIDTSEVSFLPGSRKKSSAIYKDVNEKVNSAVVELPFIILDGSAIRFELHQ